MWFGQRHGFQKLILLNRRYYHSPKSLLEDLTERGFIQDVSRHDVLQQAIVSKRQTVYVGVDPTAKSLHIGHLVPLLCLLHFQLRGHGIVPLIGGATGRVGDPSGRMIERQLAEVKQVEANVVGLTTSIQRFFKRALLYASTRSSVSCEGTTYPEPQVVSNLQWHGSFTLLQFLQTVGVHARVNTMLARDSVRSRLESQQGLSFMEFTYQLLQAYDFYHLHKHFGCTIQIGGSDQWGNIVAGLELIGKIKAAESPDPFGPDVFGITTPLLTTSTGEKFGKSAGNAVWLDSDLTSIFDFYQYFLRVTDVDVGKYLYLFTLMTPEEISELLKSHNKAPEKRVAQHRLAAEVTEMVHLKSGVAQAIVMSKLLFHSGYKDIKAKDVTSAFDKDPRLVNTTLAEILGTPIPKLAAKHGLVLSNSAARTLVSSRGLYLNGRTVQEAQYTASQADLLDGKMVIIRAGKDKMLVLVATD